MKPFLIATTLLFVIFSCTYEKNNLLYPLSTQQEIKDILRHNEEILIKGFEAELNKIENSLVETAYHLPKNTAVLHFSEFIQNIDTASFFKHYHSRQAFHFNLKNESTQKRHECPDLIELEYIEKSNSFKVTFESSIYVDNETGCQNEIESYWFSIEEGIVTLVARNDLKMEDDR